MGTGALAETCQLTSAMASAAPVIASGATRWPIFAMRMAIPWLVSAKPARCAHSRPANRTTTAAITATDRRSGMKVHTASASRAVNRSMSGQRRTATDRTMAIASQTIPNVAAHQGELTPERAVTPAAATPATARMATVTENVPRLTSMFLIVS